MHQKARNEMIQNIHNKGYKVIGIYLNYSDEFLLKRINDTSRDTQYLNLSKSFQEVLSRQKDIFVEPRSNEFDFLFEINSEDQIKEIKQEVNELVTKNL